MPPENPDKDSGNLAAWVARAQAARELVSDIDFDAVARHDPQAVARLAATTEELRSLATEPDSPATANAGQSPMAQDDALRAARCLESLEAAGHGERLGRVLMSHEGKVALRPLEVVPHREGLPAFDVCIAPADAEGDGAHALFLTDCEIISARCVTPLLDNPWMISNRQSFTAEQELISLIGVLCTES